MTLTFDLPLPGQEVQVHPPSMTWEELNRLQNIRPFLGWTAYPPLTYDEWAANFSMDDCPVYDRRPGRQEYEYVRSKFSTYLNIYADRVVEHIARRYKRR